MASIAQYQEDIRRYQVLQGQVSRVAAQISAAADSTGRLDMEIKSNYQVDGNNPVITEDTATLKRELEETAAYLTGTVSPAIDSSIEYARREIARLEEEERRRREEEERRRQEEEERKRQEEENKS